MIVICAQPRRVRRWGIIAWLVLGGVLPVHAQRQEPPGLGGRVQVTPYFGAFVLEDQRYDNTLFLGARVGTDIVRRYSVEGGLAYASTGYHYDFNNATLLENVGLVVFFADFVYNYPLSASFIAFGSFGVGGLASYPESRSSRTDAMYDFGGGLKAFLKPNLLLRLDVRQYSPSFDIDFFSPRSGNLYVSPTGSPKSDIQKIMTITAGLSFIL